MVDFNPQPEDQQPDPGGLGGPVRGIRDTRLLERALRERWPIPDQYREGIINRQVKIAIDPGSSPRESTSAARCLVAMEAQNVDAMLKALDKVVPDQHEMHHTIEEIRAAADETRRDAAYVEFERTRTIEARPHAGLNGSNGKPGPLDTNGSSGAH